MNFHSGRPRKARQQALSLTELLVALVVLSVGMLALVTMNSVLRKGSRSAADLSAATNLCQTKLEELTVLDWADWGSASTQDTLEDQWMYGLAAGQILQETQLNALGNMFEDQFEVASAEVGNPCHGVALPQASDTNACADYLRSLGPYIYTRSMVMCRGEDYDPSGNPPVGTNVTATPVPDAVKPEREPDCRITPEDTMRPASLTCQSSDVVDTTGTTAFRYVKVAKVLCTWRNRDGSCGSVSFQNTRANLNP